MKVETTTEHSSNGRHFTASSWAVLGLAVLFIGIFWAFIGAHVAGPSDGARFMWGPSAFRPNGVEVTPPKVDPELIRDGDVVVAIEGRPLESWIKDSSSPWTARSRWEVGQTVTYTVERDGVATDLSLTLQKYPLGAILARSWGIFLTAFLLVLVSFFVFFKRPSDPAARILLLFCAGGVSSTVWALGLEPIDLTLSFEFWLFSATNFFSYTFVWIALLHFWLVFPTPADLVQRRAWVVPSLYLLPYAINIVTAAAMWPASASTLDWLARSANAHPWTPVVYMVLALV